jgi:peptide/nickel transport system permease protein
MSGSTRALPSSSELAAEAVTGRTTSRGFLARARRVLVRNRTALWGTLFIAFFVLMAIIGPAIAPYDPYAVTLSERFQPPGASHWFGTDNLGRDILTRTLYGARISLWVGVLTVSLAMVVGVPLGLIAGYRRGFIDSALMRLVDVFLAFPVIILAIAIVAVRGPSLTNVMVALVAVYWTTYARITRGVTLVLRQEDFVLAAESIGVPAWRTMARHLLPNAMAPILVIATLGLGNAILAEAALSFLGLGIQPPEASWGSMLNFGMQFLRDAPWLTIFPGLAIFFTVLGFNMLGDGLRDAMDPRLRQ